MRKYRIVTTINSYCNSNNHTYTIQSYYSEFFGLFGAWVDICTFNSLDKAKEALIHISKPDIYL